MLKKRYLFLMILVCFFAISAVSAEDNSTSDIVSLSNDVNSLEANSNMNSIANGTDTLKVSNDEVLTAGNNWYVNGSKTSSGDGKSPESAFVSLKEAIDSASADDTIMIASGEYKGSKNTGLVISKNLNIIKYGNSEAIFDAERLSRIWTVNAKFISITGLTFKNGMTREDEYVENVGGAIYFKNDGNVTDCTFTDNTARSNGGALYFGPLNYDYTTSCLGIITNSTFTGNTANTGGAIYFRYSASSVTNSTFTGNTAEEWNGGAVYFEKHGFVINSTFTGNTADNSGGAVCFLEKGFVTNSTFTGNTADNSGGAIESSDYTGLKNSIFESNCAKSYDGGAIRSSGVVKIDNCTFLKNHARKFGGAILTDTIIWVDSPSYFIGNYAEKKNGGAIYTNKFETDIKYGVFINNTVKSNDDGGAIYIYQENHLLISQCYFENNRCGDEGGAIYLDFISSTLSLKYNIFVGNWAGDKGNIVYNKGEYTTIHNNWYGNNLFDFSNELVEYNFWGSDKSHQDDKMVIAELSLNETGQPSKLIVTFLSDEELFNYDAKFSADNGAILTNHKIGNNTVTSDIIFEDGITTVNATINSQVLTLSYSYFKENVTMDINASEISFGDNATVNIIFTPNNATGTVSVGNISSYIVNGAATVIIPNLSVGNHTLPVIYSGDWVYNPKEANVTITVNRKNLNINASAKPIHHGENATVIVTALEYATGNVTVTINNTDWTGKITNGTATINIYGLNETTTANVTYPGDANYTNASTTVTIVVNPRPKDNLTISASADPIMISEDAEVIVTGLENATGNVTVKIGSDEWYGEIIDGTANVIVTGLTRNVTASVFYAGDYKYNNATTTVNITVNPAITVWYVNESKTSSGNGTTPDTAFKTLKEAINKAPENSTIYIASGTYTGENNINLTINKNLNFINYGDGEVIFDAQGLSRIWTVQATSINITGLTFKNGKEQSVCGAIFFNQTLNNSCINAIFINNTAVDGLAGAVGFYADVINTNINSIFTENTVNNGYGGAIFFNGNLSNVNITGNYTSNSANDFGGAIVFYGNLTNVNILGNFSSNKANDSCGAIFFNGKLTDVNISGSYNNNLANNTAGVFLFNSNLTNVVISGEYTNNAAEYCAVYYMSDFATINNSSISGNYYNNSANYCVVFLIDGIIKNSNISGNYTNNKAEMSINIISEAYNVSISGNYINNNISDGRVIYIKYCDENSSIHDSIFINNTIDDKLIIDITSSSVLSVNNWFGNNASNYNIKPKVGENVTMANWLFLNATANTTELKINETAEITFKLYTYNSTSKEIKDYDASKMNIILDLSQIHGMLNQTNALINETVLYKYEEEGIASVTGKFETAFYIITFKNILYVNASAAPGGDGSKSKPFNTLKDALTIAQDGNTIMIASGEYKGTNNTGLSINKKLNFIKYGDGEAIFDAESQRRIWTVTATSINIDRITFKNGKTSDDGSAIYFMSSVSNSIISGEFINNLGGAIYFADTVSDLNISGEFIKNTAKSGSAINFCKSVFNSSVSGKFINNTAYFGGAIHFSGSVSDLNISGEFINNDGTINFYNIVSNSSISGKFIKNTGNVIYFDEIVSNSSISGEFINNTGGVIHFGNSVSNCNISGVFINNTADNRAIIRFNEASQNVTISNAIFLNNKYDEDTGVISAGGAGVVAIDNWFGNNATNYNTPPKTTNIKMDSWLFLNTTVNPIEILIGQNSTITFKLDSYNSTSNTTSPYDASKMNVTLKLSQTLGQLNQTTALISEEILYTAKQEGNGSVTGKFETASYTINLKNNRIPTEINITNATVTLKVNDNISSGATLTPPEAGNLTYNSSNSTVAVVENGMIKGLKEGTAVITVSFAGNDEYAPAENKTITVTVKLKDASVSVNNNTLNLTVNETFNLIATTNPAGLNVTYHSNNETIATVDANGKVTAKAKGSTIITASVGGDGVYALNSTNVTVTVNKIPTEINITNATVTLKVNDNISSGATLTPPEAGNLTYTSSDPNVAKVENGIIKGLKEGTATITVSFAGNDEYAPAENKTITVTVKLKDASVSVNNNTLNLTVNDTFNLIATTNPAGLNVTYHSNNENIATVDSNGKVTAKATGTAIITASVGGDGVYALNSTNVTVTVNKIPTEINITNATVTLKVNDNISSGATLTPPEAGNLTYTSSDPNVAKVENGIIKGLKEGTATITVSFAGNDEYTAAENKTITVTVNLRDASVSVNNNTLNLTVNDTFNLIATTNPAGLNVTYHSNNENIATVDANGKITAKAAGSAIITASVGGDGVYALNSTNVTVTVKHIPPKENLTISASAEPITVGENATVIVTGLENATGNVTVSIGSNNWTGKINQSIANVIVSGLTENATAIVSYAGNTQYNPTSTTVNITVYPKSRENLTISASAEPITVGDNATVIVTGLENATGEVNVTVNGKTYTAPIKNSEATVIISGLTETVTGNVNYPGDEKYNPASTTVNITVNPKPKENLTISASAQPITVGENATVIVTGFINDGMASGTVTVTVGDKTFNGTIVPYMIGGAIAEIIVPGLNETTIAKVNYLGDEFFNPANTTVEIIVYPNPDKKNLTLEASAEPIMVGDNATIIVTGFENATGNVSARVEGGTLYAHIINGSATFTVSGLTSNTTAYIIYEGDANYNNASTTVNITVYPKSDVVIVAENVTKYYHGPERFVANIYDPEGNPLVNKSVNITINGVTYTKITDANGTVSIGINLGSGTYDVTTTVDNTTVKSSITVLSTLTGKDIIKYYRNGTQYSVQVFDTTGKAVGKGEVVTFNINGIFYNRTTDENGIATLNINLPQGEYVITAINPVTGEMHANNITVLPVLAANDLTMKYLDGTQFKVNLVDGQGNPYKDQFIRFNINGKFYDRLTDSNGQAALNIRLPPGEYIITSSFNGCNIANKITITG